MRYNSFMAMIIPFVNSRGELFVFPPEALEATVNLSIQQIYNEYKWSWLLTEDTLSTFNDAWTYLIKEGTNPIKYSLWVEKTLNWTDSDLVPARSITELSECTYLINGSNLIVSEEATYIHSYLRDYTFQSYLSDPSMELDIPEKFIPALYYLVLSQIDLIDAQQLQWQPASNFNKYVYEMKNLSSNDMMFSAQLIWANPA